MAFSSPIICPRYQLTLPFCTVSRHTSPLPIRSCLDFSFAPFTYMVSLCLGCSFPTQYMFGSPFHFLQIFAQASSTRWDLPWPPNHNFSALWHYLYLEPAMIELVCFCHFFICSLFWPTPPPEVEAAWDTRKHIFVKFLHACLSWGFYSGEKPSWPKATWGGKSSFQLTVSRHSPWLREFRSRQQKHGGRSWWRAFGGMLLTGFISLLLQHWWPPASRSCHCLGDLGPPTPIIS